MRNQAATSYSEKLKDPRWQRKRLEIMQRDKFECQYCGDNQSQLAVHHRYYISKRQPWDYPDWALRTLCSDCHAGDHDETKNEGGRDLFEDIMLMMGSGNNFEEDFIWTVALEFNRALGSLSIMDASYAVIEALQKARGEALNE
jgi:carotenoid cleavage dioxygenase-like enzyme